VECWWSFSRGHLRVRSQSGCHAPTSASSPPLTESLTAAATMSPARGSCDEVEFLYSKPAYVSWVSSDIPWQSLRLVLQ